MKSVLFVVNVDWFFVSHRLPIALEAQKKGYKVTIACSFTIHEEELKELGFNVIDVPFTRSGGGMSKEVSALVKLRKTIKELAPDIIHAVTIKPVIYAGLMQRTLSRKASFIAAISGLGYVFSANSMRAKLTKFIASTLYRIALKQKSKKIIFQNSSDEVILTSIANLSPSDKVLIKGSGADLSVYNYQPEKASKGTVVVMACRLLKEKGVYDYVEAAKLVKESDPTVRFLLVGPIDEENPHGVSGDEIESWIKSGVIEYLGHRSDIPAIFAESNIICLPSYYGEGVPKVLIEAAACGRAIITTTNPGCRDAVIDKETGLLVEPRNPRNLADNLLHLTSNVALRENMGSKARLFAEAEFDVQSVVQKHIEIYTELG